MTKAKRPPLVMIHGAFVGPWSFDKFRMPFEAAGYDVHIPTLRYHDRGMNPPSELGSVSLVDYAKDLAKVINGLDEPPILLGHSLGGLLAQMLAAKGKARALVLLAPCPPGAPGQLCSDRLGTDRGAARPDLNRSSARLEVARRLLDASRRSQALCTVRPQSGRATFEIMHRADATAPRMSLR